MSANDSSWPISNGSVSFVEIFNRAKAETGFLPGIKVHNSSNEILCTFNLSDHDQYTINVECNGEENRNVIDSLRMTGLLDLVFTYTKSNDPFSSTPTSKKISENDFFTWFQSLVKGRTLVPDTNSILNHTFSSITRIFGDSILKDTNVLIPRLVILEMERRANSKQNVDCNNPANEKERCYCKDKKLIMLGYEEIMFLRSKGARMFPDLDAEILARFTQIAGDLTSDSWIRKEIKSWRVNTIKQKQSIGGSSDPGPLPQFILISSDLINSLSASAEGIDSIYISKPVEFKTRNAKPEQVAKFLTYHSVTKEHLKVEVGSKQYEIKGFWSGKTTFDILNDRIMIKST